jgi:hypothetical protein
VHLPQPRPCSPGCRPRTPRRIRLCFRDPDRALPGDAGIQALRCTGPPRCWLEYDDRNLTRPRSRCSKRAMTAATAETGVTTLPRVGACPWHGRGQGFNSPQLHIEPGQQHFLLHRHSQKAGLARRRPLPRILGPMAVGSVVCACPIAWPGRTVADRGARARWSRQLYGHVRSLARPLAGVRGARQARRRR